MHEPQIYFEINQILVFSDPFLSENNHKHLISSGDIRKKERMHLLRSYYNIQNFPQVSFCGTVPAMTSVVGTL